MGPDTSMVSKIERQNAVANYLLDNPQASPAEISEALCMTDRTTRYIISAMLERRVIVRSKHISDGRCNRLSLSTWHETGDTPQTAHQQLMDLANKLEQRGLWRRAATVWAELSRLQQTVTGVAMIASQRNRCIRAVRARA